MHPYTLLIIGFICTGFLGLFVKLVDVDVHYMTLNFYRVFFGFLTLLLVCPLLDKTTLRIKKQEMPLQILMGFLVAATLSFTNVAYALAPIQNVSFILSFTPFFVMICAYVLLKEQITSAKVGTFLIALIGLIIINPITAEGGLGNIFALISVPLGALMLTLMRKEEQTHGIGEVFWYFLFASLFLLPFALFFGLTPFSPYLILLGVVSTGFSCLFLNLALQKIEADVASLLLTIIVPLVSIALAVLLLGEELVPRVLLGGSFLLLAGMFLHLHLDTLRSQHKIKKFFTSLKRIIHP